MGPWEIWCFHSVLFNGEGTERVNLNSQEPGGSVWNAALQAAPLFSFLIEKKPYTFCILLHHMDVCFNMKIMFWILSVGWNDRKMLPADLCDLGCHARSSLKSLACMQSTYRDSKAALESQLGREEAPPGLEAPPSTREIDSSPERPQCLWFLALACSFCPFIRS